MPTCGLKLLRWRRIALAWPRRRVIERCRAVYPRCAPRLAASDIDGIGELVGDIAATSSARADLATDLRAVTARPSIVNQAGAIDGAGAVARHRRGRDGSGKIKLSVAGAAQPIFIRKQSASAAPVHGGHGMTDPREHEVASSILRGSRPFGTRGGAHGRSIIWSVAKQALAAPSAGEQADKMKRAYFRGAVTKRRLMGNAAVNQAGKSAVARGGAARSESLDPAHRHRRATGVRRLALAAS